MLAHPVEKRDFSPGPVHGAISLFKPKEDVFPVVHTTYDYNEVFL